MAAAGARAVGPGVTLHRSASVISDKSEANIETATVAANLIGSVEALTPPVVTRETYDRMALGTDNTVPIPGRISLGEMSFSVYFDASNSVHTALRDHDKSTQNTWIFTITDPDTANDRTYCALDGFVTQANIEELSDNQIMLNVVVACTTDGTWVDNS